MGIFFELAAKDLLFNSVNIAVSCLGDVRRVRSSNTKPKKVFFLFLVIFVCEL